MNQKKVFYFVKVFFSTCFSFRIPSRSSKTHRRMENDENRNATKFSRRQTKHRKKKNKITTGNRRFACTTDKKYITELKKKIRYFLFRNANSK